jgi:hypothetical protein
MLRRQKYATLSRKSITLQNIKMFLPFFWVTLWSMSWRQWHEARNLITQFFCQKPIISIFKKRSSMLNNFSEPVSTIRWKSVACIINLWWSLITTLGSSISLKLYLLTTLESSFTIVACLQYRPLGVWIFTNRLTKIFRSKSRTVRVNSKTQT